ncbi:MAG: GAF domain-containing protein, partial [Syntrophales bacterium]
MTEKEIRPDQSEDLRHKAEEIARESANREEALSQDLPAMTTMVHELRVYQIELEMQNTALRQREEELDAARARYFDLYDLAPVGYITVSEQGLILDANLVASTMLGTVRGGPGHARPIFSQFIHSEGQEIYYLFRKQLLETGEPQACELRMVKKDGPAFWAHLEASVAQDPSTDSFRFRSGKAGEPVVRIVMSDITDRKHNAIMAARLRLQTFAFAHSLKELLQETLREAEALTGSQVGFYHFVESDQVTLTLQAWSASTLQHMCKATDHVSHYPVSEAGVWADCIRERRPVVHNDYATLPHRKGLPAGHTPVIRELVVPVLRGDAIVAILGVGNKTENYDERDIETVTSLADLTWDMAESKRAEEAARQSEERYRTLFSRAVDGIFIMTTSGKMVDVNESFARMHGYSKDEMMQMNLKDFDTHPFSQLISEKMGQLVAGETLAFEVEHYHRDGHI